MKKLLFVFLGFFILSAFNMFNEEQLEELNSLRSGIEEAKQDQDDIEEDLCEAAKEGDDETFFDLYYDSPRKAKTICVINGRNMPLISVAARYTDDNKEILRELIFSGKDAVETRDDNGFTPLMWAVMGGQIENVKYLVNVGGAKVNATNGYGKDVLSQANDPEIIAFLKQKGAVDTSIEAKANAIIQDIIKNRPNSKDLEPKLEQLKAMGAKIPSKLYFLYNRGEGDQKCIYLLASYGANPNYYDSSKEPTPTPLLLYLNKEKDFYGCATLLKNGADPNKRNANNLTPLMAAAGATGYRTADTQYCIELLLKYGAGKATEINATDNNGKTALDYDARFGDNEVTKILIKYGAKRGSELR